MCLFARKCCRRGIGSFANNLLQVTARPRSGDHAPEYKIQTCARGWLLTSEMQKQEKPTHNLHANTPNRYSKMYLGLVTPRHRPGGRRRIQTGARWWIWHSGKLFYKQHFGDKKIFSCSFFCGEATSCKKQKPQHCCGFCFTFHIGNIPVVLDALIMFPTVNYLV